jgi:cytoskeleton protein RodZ
MMTEPINSRASEGPGALLEAARRKKGLHIAALAAQLKVSQARLEALEAERWDQLPDANHARALATSVCRVLGLDAAPVLAGMPRGAGASLERMSAGLNRSYRSDDQWRAQGPRWWFLGVLILLLAVAAGLAFWPSSAKPLPEVLIDALPAAASTAVPGLAPVPAVQLQPGSASEVTPATGPASVAMASKPSSAGAALLEIRASQGASWVSVLDANGASLAARLLSQGEVLTLEPQAPVRLTLGNAPALSLSWRGEKQTLAAYETTRVAKLELK